MERVKVGVVGCGNISSIYLENCTKRFHRIVEIKTVCDLVPERSCAQAEKYGIANVMSTQEMLADPEIELVLNITQPPNHYAVNKLSLEAGKHVYVEKPLGITKEQGEEVIALAKEKGLMIGGAPDTFLGGGLQMCRKLIDDGWIGEPIAATAFMTTHGTESWHPDPDFYYQPGAGPMLDMGPYYLTALISLMGPIKSVMGEARATFAERLITSEPKYGDIIKVNVPTHINGLLQFESGALGTIMTTFDVWRSSLPRIEVYGSEGTLMAPDPNTFGGPVKVFRPGMEAEQEVPIAFGYKENSRGLGLSDMAMAIRNGRIARTDASMTGHVLEAMLGIEESAKRGTRIALQSRCARPAPLPLGLRDGELD